MKVFTAEKAGFCFGVKRALTVIHELHRNGKTIRTFGPLIHNNAVLRNLEQKGIRSISELKGICGKETLVLRTHGVSKRAENQLKRKGVPYVDATCPLVKKTHQIIEKLDPKATRIVLVGDPSHPEIMASKSYAGRVTVLNSLKEARAFPRSKKISVIAQTTLDLEFFKRIVAVLRKKAESVDVHNTVCAATRERQDAIRRLAGEVDFVVVIGGRNSSNTRKLYWIAKKRNPHSYHVETHQELSKPAFIKRIRDFHTVGITAGASTPLQEIAQARKFFQRLHREKEMTHV
jgi:4-hydroxy-3-methylbut-2-enyl diphosphate reductase